MPNYQNPTCSCVAIRILPKTLIAPASQTVFYQNYSHILNITVVDEDQAEIIHEMINDKVISKNILSVDIPIKWIVSNESKLTYYTDVEGILGDKAVYEHTKILLNDIKVVLNTNNINFQVTKPLTKKICML